MRYFTVLTFTEGEYHIVGTDGEAVAIVKGKGNTANIKANAHLFAAAPDLLAALKRFTSADYRIEKGTDYRTAIAEAMAHAHGLIADVERVGAA